MSDSDHSTDIGTIAYLHGVESGKDFERAKIVEWLKMVKDEYRDPDGELADRVEAGEHLK